MLFHIQQIQTPQNKARQESTRLSQLKHHKIFRTNGQVSINKHNKQFHGDNPYIVDDEISQNFRIPRPNERRIVLDHKARLTTTLLLFKINELSESLFLVKNICGVYQKQIRVYILIKTTKFKRNVSNKHQSPTTFCLLFSLSTINLQSNRIYITWTYPHM